MGVAPAPVNSGKEAKPGERHGLRVYLSPATLVVVPVQLFPHWLQQVQMHVKHRSLRVHCEWESAAQAKSKSEDRGQLGPAPGAAEVQVIRSEPI
eukprot:gene2828-4977_t